MTSKPIRVAVIDSGVNPDHPHVLPIAGGVHITPDGIEPCFTDFLGHGTAVTGAIREKATSAAIYAVKVFDRSLSTTGQVLLRALDWCLDEQIDFINLSLGTLNTDYIPSFETRIERALTNASTIVSAYEMNGQPAFPGSLSGVAGVKLDNSCSRDRYFEFQQDGRRIFAACGFPRNIPGVPPRRNLQGISFAVANVTGWLARQAQSDECPGE